MAKSPSIRQRADRLTVVSFYAGAVVLFACGLIATIVGARGDAGATDSPGDSVQREVPTRYVIGASLGTFAERVLLQNPGATVCVVASGLGGELEGCTCSGPQFRGGLLQNLWRVDRLRNAIPDPRNGRWRGEP